MNNKQGRFPGVCRGCTERVLGCHETCEKYAKAKEDYATKQEAAAEAKKN